MLTQTQTRYGNMVYFANDDPIGACLKHYGEWAQQELDLISTFLKEDSVVMDVGANIGTHSLAFSHICPSGFVLAFEPQQYIFNILTTNCTINQRFNIYPVLAGVSKENGKIRMSNRSPFTQDPKVNYGEFKINNDAHRGAYTDIVKLDNYLECVPKVNLIKIDVEGMEVDVLDGGRELIGKYKPIIYLEFSEKEGNDPLLEYIYSLNYIPYIHVYEKHNPNNFNKQSFNVWEEDSFILQKDNMHKRYDASIICFHKDNEQPNMIQAKMGDSLFSFLFERALI